MPTFSETHLNLGKIIQYCGIHGKYLGSKSLNFTILVLICENCLATPFFVLFFPWREVQNIKFWLKHFPKSKEAYFIRDSSILFLFFPPVEEYACHQAIDWLFFSQSEYRSFKNLSLEMFPYQKPPEQGLHLFNINADFKALSSFLKIVLNNMVMLF